MKLQKGHWLLLYTFAVKSPSNTCKNHAATAHATVTRKRFKMTAKQMRYSMTVFGSMVEADKKKTNKTSQCFLLLLLYEVWIFWILHYCEILSTALTKELCYL